MELGLIIFGVPLAIVMGILYGLMDAASDIAKQRADRAENRKLRRLL